MSYLNLNPEKTEKTVEQLNILLADYHLYYQKLRNFHWNVEGINFFDLHAKFEEMYDDAKLKIDEIAERILTLRHKPVSNLSEYLKMTNISESDNNLNDRKMIDILLSDHGKILNQLRTVSKAADLGEDEGTLDFIGTYIAELEKTSWMLEVWTKKLK